MTKRAALVFPGQGSQRVGMLAEAPHNDDLERLLDAAEALSDIELRTIAMMGDDQDLADTRIAQPLLYLADWAWGIALLETGVDPVAVAGHSLGELAALAVAGAFSAEAGLELVVERSKLMSHAAAHTPGAMAAVLGLDADKVAGVVERLDSVWVANDNAPGQVVISGEREAVEAASEALSAAGARRVVPLKVSGAFHSPMMKDAASAFAGVLRGAEFSATAYPVLQNTEPVPTRDPEVIRERLVGQITAPVRWTETMQALAADGEITVIEAGPGAVLTGLAKRVDGVTAVSAEAAGLEAILEEVS